MKSWNLCLYVHVLIVQKGDWEKEGWNLILHQSSSHTLHTKSYSSYVKPCELDGMLSLLETRKLRHKEISHFANVPSDRVRIPPQSTQPQSLGFFSVLHCLHHIAYHVIVMHLPTVCVWLTAGKKPQTYSGWSLTSPKMWAWMLGLKLNRGIEDWAPVKHKVRIS